MEYGNIVPVVFRNRPNRFIAEVEIDGQKETVHVKNTGRNRYSKAALQVEARRLHGNTKGRCKKGDAVKQSSHRSVRRHLRWGRRLQRVKEG